MGPDFSAVSEAPGVGVTLENARMLFTRYDFGRRYCAGKDVLEIACGAGMGLELLAGTAKSVVGGDLDPSFVASARRRYGERLRVDEIDAASLPYKDGSFDVALLMEAIYLLPDAVKAVAEARRILRPGGVFVVVSANREWSLFNPCERCTMYYSAAELKKLMESVGFEVELFKGFEDQPRGLKSKLLGLARKVVVGLHLIPNTMKGKELMKRLAYGRLIVLPEAIEEGFATPASLERHDGAGPISRHKVIYAVGRVV